MFWTKYLIIILLFSAVLEIDCCMSVNTKRHSKFMRERRKMPCNEHFSNKWCLNGGTCYVIEHRNQIDYHCSCPGNFTGDRCVTELNESTTKSSIDNKIPCDEPLKSDFCLNQGTCYALVFGRNSLEYHCECPEGYHGYKCEEKSLDGFYGTGMKVN